jgi:tetratricopeptide (TPR) repeat protein
LIQTYEAELREQGITCERIRLDRKTPSLKDSLLELPTEAESGPQVVTVLGADELLGIRLSEAKSAQEKFFFSVQWTREGLRAFPYPIVLWVTEEVAVGLGQEAPDFWSWRGGLFEFVRPQVNVIGDKVGGDRVSGDKVGGDKVGGDKITHPFETNLPIADPSELVQQLQSLLASDPDSPLLASLYFSLGRAYKDRLDQGKTADYRQETQLAVEAYQQAIKRQEHSATLDLASSLNNLGLLYNSTGRYESALPLYEQAVEICKSELGDRNPLTATNLNNLGLLYNSMGRHESALPLLVQALEIRKSVLGIRHSDTAQSLNNLAGLYHSIGRYESALPLYEQALEIRKSVLGARHLDTAQSLNNLAGLYEAMGRYESALSLYEQALEIRKSVLGAQHPDTAQSLSNLAGLYYSTNRLPEAAAMMFDALSIREETLGPDHPNTVKSRKWLEIIQRAIENGQS